MCVWIEDADKLEINSAELEIVYINRSIKSYMEGSTLGLCGIKGQGKTFLIKVKRKKDESSVVSLPMNRMLDTIDSSLEIDKSLFRFLTDYNIWVNLWKFSLSSAIIKKNIADVDLSPLKEATKKLISMQNIDCAPSFYFKYLLRLNINDFRNLLQETSKLLDIIRNYHNGIHVYIDKIDQGFSNYIKNFNEDSKTPLRSRQASFWQYSQFSLAEASYDIYTNIKIGRAHV